MGDTSRRAAPPPPREKVFQRSDRSARAAREFVRGVLAAWGMAEREEDVRLCVSELATNALCHGAPPGPGFRIRLAVSECAVLRVEVHDHGSGRPRVRRPGPADEGGRGLLLVHALSDAWGVGEPEPGRPGKIVWCEFDLRRDRFPLTRRPRPVPDDAGAG